jgi:Flp pilus assembly protein TadG
MQSQAHPRPPGFGLLLGGLFFGTVACSQVATQSQESHGSTAAAAQLAAQPVNETALATMPIDAQAQVNAAPVPVLAPIEPSLLKQAEVTTGNGYYSLSSRGEGIAIVIQGSPLQPNTATLATAPVATRAAGPRRVFTTLNEGIRSASWVEGRVAYSLDVECSRPSDPRCAGEDYVLGLVAKLAMVGGRRQ